MPTSFSESGVNHSKIAYAVAMAETGDCTKGYGLSHNNCFGIMAWNKQGERYPKRYKNKQESYKDFIRIWKKYYKTMPNEALAKKYTGDDNADTWLFNVNYYLNTT